MRIIAGKYGSRPLRSLRGGELRPSSDRLRETLFNILGPAIARSVFVDLYAGTGAVGIEALSRGADEVVFVEKHAAAVKLIRSNLRSLGITLPGERPGRPRLVQPRGAQDAPESRRPGESRAAAVEFPGDEPSIEVFCMDAVKALTQLHQRRLLADFVFLDPPYAATQEYERVLEALSHGHVLAPTGRVIVEALRVAKRPPARGETPATNQRAPEVASRRHEASAIKSRQTNAAIRRGESAVSLRSSAWEPPDRIGALERTRTVEQGDSLLVFYRLALAA